MPTRDDRIDIPVDDQQISGTLVTPATAVPAVLFLHGWGGTQEQYLARPVRLPRWAVSASPSIFAAMLKPRSRKRPSRARTICVTHLRLMALWPATKLSTKRLLRWWAAAMAATWLPS
jgi:hypothetical protein